MKVIEAYTSEQINSTENLAQIITTISDSKRVIVAVAINAYLDGFMAGNNLEAEIKLNSEQFYKSSKQLA